MPRQARRLSSTGIYHVILRGINHQQIFEDAQDRRKFLDCLRKFKQECSIAIYAFCLMGNHIHLLLHSFSGTPPGLYLQKVEVSFVRWYNVKYDRFGPLFPGRFKSEPVETKRYLLSVFRYIHMNPVKACLCGHPEEYAYSSFHAYNGMPDNLTDTEKIFSYFDTAEEIRQFTTGTVVSACMDLRDDTSRRLMFENGKSIFQKVTGIASVASFQKLDIPERNRMLIRLRRSGLSVNQINRHTGVSRALIYKVLRTGNKRGQVTTRNVPELEKEIKV